jgi:serine/threonine-protein kinase
MGLTHRDIKPRNVFLCRMGLNFDFVKVLDFGLVKIRGPAAEQTQLTQQGVTTGTPAFMPPELAVGSEEIDGRTDIYALGCVAYWLLTGGLVFTAPNALAMALEHVRSTPEPPSRRTEIDIPADLEELILQCLEKDPSNRPQSAREISQRLSAIAAARDWSNDHAERWWQLHQPQMRETIGVFAEFSGQVTAS